jgi:hypothetical protein
MFYSEQVKTLFSAVYTTTNQLGAKVSAVQGRDVTKHLAELVSLICTLVILRCLVFSANNLIRHLQWLDLLRSMMIEAEWRMNQYVPTVEEYMTNAVVSFALGPIVLPALYFVGEKLSENIFKDEECSELFKLMSTCGRLLNDCQGFEVFGTLSSNRKRKNHFYCLFCTYICQRN